MAFPGTLHPDAVPLHTLFPEAYAESARMIVRDFALFGCWIVGSIVGVAYFFG